MARYIVNNELGGTAQNLTTAYLSIVGVYAGATARRGKVYEIIVGTDGTPNNNALDWDLARITATGTGTAVTPNPVDPADAAALAGAKANFTVEPTVTANSSLWFEGLNQQATHRWQAYDAEAMLVFPATSNNGLVLRAKSAAYASTCTGQLGFQE